MNKKFAKFGLVLLIASSLLQILNFSYIGGQSIARYMILGCHVVVIVFSIFGLLKKDTTKLVKGK